MDNMTKKLVSSVESSLRRNSDKTSETSKQLNNFKKSVGEETLSGSLDKSIKIHEYITNEQIFTALMCMWKLDYPTEIIHEIFGWLGINTYG